MKRLEQGLVHIYTGDGKGKTTAALGQGMRTAGNGLKVLMTQFLKGDDTGELHSIEKLSPNFTLLRFGELKNFYHNLTPQRKIEVQKEIQEGLEKIRGVVRSGEYDLVILDEIMAVLYLNIVSLDGVVSLLKEKPKHVEMILTGRNAPEELIKLTDYVTKMTMIKHPFERGIMARKGIES